MAENLGLLIFVCYMAAVCGGVCYAYGYIIKSKGDRRWHAAGLLFSALALANLPNVLRQGANGSGAFAGYMLVTFMILSLLCQAMTSLRRRSSDRRARSAEGAPSPADQTPAR
jgi:hypothetical protein